MPDREAPQGGDARGAEDPVPAEGSTTGEILPSQKGDLHLPMELREQLPIARRMLVSVDEAVAEDLEGVVPGAARYIGQIARARVGELYWLDGDPVADIGAKFAHRVFILMGRRLGGPTQQSITEEGEARIELLAHFLRLGVIDPKYFKKTIFSFSGHNGEAEAFFATFLMRMMKSGLPWTHFRENMHMEYEAQFSNENIVFSHDDVLEKLRTYGDSEGPILWIVCSTDYHILSLLIAHWACEKGPGSPLAPLLESSGQGDRVAFLSAPDPYRANWDRGIGCAQRIMDATFYFAQAIQNNLGSLLDQMDPAFTRRKKSMENGKKVPLRSTMPKDRWLKIKRSQQYPGRNADRLYEKAVQLFEILPKAIECVQTSLDWPGKDSKGEWQDTRAGKRLDAINAAVGKLELERWLKGRGLNPASRGQFGNIVRDLYDALAQGESVSFEQMNSIMETIRSDIISDIRWWADPENK